MLVAKKYKKDLCMIYAKTSTAINHSRQTEYHFFEYSFLGGGGIFFNKLSSSHILCPVSSYRFLSLILKG